MDTDNSVVKAREGGSGWREARTGKRKTSVIVSTIKKKTNMRWGIPGYI